MKQVIKQLINFITLVMLFVTVPWAITSETIEHFNFQTLEEPWLFSLQALIWFLIINLELVILGALGFVKQTNKITNRQVKHQ